MYNDKENIISAMESIKAFLMEMKEENDRAIVIVGAANIDLLLKRLIQQSLLPRFDKQKDELLDQDSPLSSFGSRIRMCYRLGLIDKQFCQLLHILRKIRNGFAHEIKGCNLNSSPHSERVFELIKDFDGSALLAKLRKLFPGKYESSRDFRIALSLISSLLEMKLRSLPKVMKANPISVSWIPEDVDI